MAVSGRRHFAGAVGAGLGAGVVLTGTMLALRLWLDTPSFPEQIQDRLLGLVPGALFSAGLRQFGFAAKPALFVAIVGFQIVAATLLGALYGALSRHLASRVDLTLPITGAATGLFLWVVVQVVALPLLDAPSLASLAADAPVGPPLAMATLPGFAWGATLAVLLRPLAATAVPAHAPSPPSRYQGRAGRALLTRRTVVATLLPLAGAALTLGSLRRIVGGMVRAPGVPRAGVPVPALPPPAPLATATPVASAVVSAPPPAVSPTAEPTTPPNPTPPPPSTTTPPPSPSPTPAPSPTAGIATTATLSTGPIPTTVAAPTDVVAVPDTPTPLPSPTPFSLPPTAPPTVPPLVVPTPSPLPSPTAVTLPPALASFIPEGVAAQTTPVGFFYTISKNFVDPTVRRESWRLQISGQVASRLTLGYNDLLALPAESRDVTLECISNEIGGALISSARWTGIPLRVVLATAGVSMAATTVVFTSADGYEESLPLAKALDPMTMLAYAMNGAPLTDAHGFPARVLTTGRYGMKNPKWVTGIEVTSGDRPGYWGKQGWNPDAPIQTMARIDTPARGRALPLAPLVVGGVAFAGDRGIARVELSTDEGSTWTAARLEPPLSPYTWVRWAAPWQPPGVGSYVLVARAYEADGTPQAMTKRDPFPNGAAGYDRALIVVTR